MWLQQTAKALGCKIKLLAISANEREGIYTSVRPVIVPLNGYMGKVQDEFNGILLEGDAVGQMFFCGKGAGKLPTASAVLGDIFDVLENEKQKSMFINHKNANILNKWSRSSEWLLRINCSNKQEMQLSLKDIFNNAIFINSLDTSKEELAVLIKVRDEGELDSFLVDISTDQAVKSIKKMLKLEI